MKNLFVGNLNFKMTEGELRAMFEPFGEVARVHLVTDRDTGRARGFAFVEMTNDEEAEKAIAALQGKQSGGRAINVNEARPKPERGSAPRGAGGHAGHSSGRGRGGFSRDDYEGAARQPREPRW